MNRCFLLPATVALCLLLAATGHAQLSTATASPPPVKSPTTPLNYPMQEEQEMPITCEQTKAPTLSETRIFESPKEADTAKGTWHYKLWLPKGYLTSGLKKWPCLFVMSAGGNASMGVMADHLKAKGFVVVLLADAKNGPWGPIIGNFLAAHDDVVKRARIDETKKFATGESGGARGSSLFAQARPGFCGLVLQAAGPAAIKGNYEVQGIQRNGKLYVAMTMGNSDQNYSEIARTKAAINNPTRFQAFEFTGGHQWAPQETFEKAMTWIESKNGM